MKFFPVMLLACIAGASSVFAHLNELNEAEERRVAVSQSDNPNRFIGSVASNEHVWTPKQGVSLENSLEDVLLNKKGSSSESPEKGSMRNLRQNNEIQLEETANEQSETNSKNSQRATTEGRLAKLGLKVGEEIDLMLTKIKNKMKNYFPLRS